MKAFLDIWLRCGHWLFLILFTGFFGIAFLLPNTQQWCVVILIILPGLFLLISGLIPFFPSYKSLQSSDYTPIVSYVLRLILGISIIVAAVAMHFGWEAKQIIVIGFGICCVVLIIFGLYRLLNIILF